MKYIKPSLTVKQQAEQLIKRGLISDNNELISSLNAINYYRLSGYLYPYRQHDDSYISGTTLDIILLHYNFDKKLRILILSAVERLEVAIRTKIIYHFSQNFGAFGHLKLSNIPHLDEGQHKKWLNILIKESSRSKEKFVEHFKDKYGDEHNYLPIWMAAELMSFGTLLTFYRGLGDNLKKKISNEFNIPDKLFLSWLTSINSVRNICAHHGRIWNRVFGYKPLLPSKNKFPNWYNPTSFFNDRVFVILTIINYLLSFLPFKDLWKESLFKLISEYPEIELKKMGFPPSWKKSPLWN